MPDLKRHSIAIIVLAAGRGTRMGIRPKLLLPLADGKPILWHAVSNAVSLEPLEVIVVVRPDLADLTTTLEDLPVRCVVNARYMEGMASSLAAGVDALGKDTEAVIVMLGDEPSVPARIVDELVAAYSRERRPVTVPVYGSEVGPPTLFAREIFPSLLGLQGDAGGRQIIARHPELVCEVRFREDERPIDIDTPTDYQAHT